MLYVPNAKNSGDGPSPPFFSPAIRNPAD